jgi:flagellar protein FliS
MFGTSARRGANAYAAVSIETGVLAANPHKLIVMLFDGALLALSNAQQQITAGNVPGKGKSISHAISIIESGLRASLDKKAGGELAGNLDSLYEYMIIQLMYGNLHNNVGKIAEVQNLLKDLKGAWESIAPVSAAVAEVQPAAYDALAPRKMSMFSA